jgi:membrane associated rhomboid family serine protease
MLIPFRDESRAETAPLLTMLLIGLNITIYLFSSLGGALDGMIKRYGFTPVAVVHSPDVLVCSIFLHANLLHLISNMWFLWLYGDKVEDRFGRLPYFGLYLLSGIAGNLIHAIFTGFNTASPVIGASGAVAGIMGSYMICFPRARIKSIIVLVFYPLFFQLPAILLLGLWMAGEFWMAMIASPVDHVAHWAHVGGFILGVIWGWPQRHRYASSRGWWWQHFVKPLREHLP